MNDKILINPKTNQEYRDVPPTVAAEYLGVALNYVYEGLKKQTLPIGSAVQSDKGRWSYNIPIDRLKTYASGADISLLTTLLNKLIGSGNTINRKDGVKMINSPCYGCQIRTTRSQKLRARRKRNLYSIN